LCAITCGSMSDQNRILNHSFFILRGFSECPIMNPQLRQAFARGELEITNDVISFRRRGVLSCTNDTGNSDCQSKRNKAMYARHHTRLIVRIIRSATQSSGSLGPHATLVGNKPIRQYRP
jgi:hypothetical protein